MTQNRANRRRANVCRSLVPLHLAEIVHVASSVLFSDFFLPRIQMFPGAHRHESIPQKEEEKSPYDESNCPPTSAATINQHWYDQPTSARAAGTIGSKV